MTANSVKHRKTEAIEDLAQRRVVTALHKLLVETSIEKQLEFLQRLCLRFTLTTTDKGLYVCRVFKQTNIDGEVTTIEDYTQGGKTPHAALVNAISDFLACSYGDYHDYMHDDWAGFGKKQFDPLTTEVSGDGR